MNRKMILFLTVAGAMSLSAIDIVDLSPRPGAKYPLPAEYRDVPLFEITNSNFSSIKYLKQLAVVNDADAAGGKAIKLAGVDFTGDFVMGIQGRTSKKTLAWKRLKKTDYPQDGKYHFYSLGKVTLEPQTLFFGHNSWALQQDISRYFNAEKPELNPVEVVVSLKFTGKSFIAGSSDTDAVYLDRILLVRQHRELKAGAKYPLPDKYAGKNLLEITSQDFSSIKYLKSLSLTADADAAGGKAIKLAGVDLAGDFVMGIQGRTSKKTLAWKRLKKTDHPQDGKYHFYSLGKVTLEPQTLFFGHNSWALQQDISRYFNAEKPELNPVEVVVSLKFTGKSFIAGSSDTDAVYLDRILLVRQ